MFRLIGWIFRGILSIVLFPFRLLGGFSHYHRPHYGHRPPHYSPRPHYGRPPMHHGHSPHHF